MGILLEIICWLWVGLTCLCRLYLGRHSVDQLLFGLLLGFFHCIFCLRIVRPYLYDPIFFPQKIEGRENLVRAVERSRTAAIYACGYYLFVCVKLALLYEYIERNNVIPQQWWDSITLSCPDFQIKHTFHNFSIFHAGYIITVPMSYLNNYWSKNRMLKTGENYIETSSIKPAMKVLEGVLRTGIFLYIGMDLIRKKLPMMIFGTLNLQPYPGFIQFASLKGSMMILYGPCTQWLRRNFTSSERVKQN